MLELSRYQTDSKRNLAADPVPVQDDNQGWHKIREQLPAFSEGHETFD
jgi:hypothetical protein